MSIKTQKHSGVEKTVTENIIEIKQEFTEVILLNSTFYEKLFYKFQFVRTGEAHEYDRKSISH